MALIGYARVSTSEQNEARQLVLFEKMGVEKYYLDKLSGKDTNRPQLQAMLEYVREGDTVIVSEYSRLARSTQDLLAIVQQLKEKGVELISDKEKMDTSSPQGKLMTTFFAALSEFERELTLQRQREGIAVAKTEGKYKGRKPIPLDEEKFHRECGKWLRGQQTAAATMKLLEMKPNRFYRTAKALGYEKDENGKWKKFNRTTNC